MPRNIWVTTHGGVEVMEVREEPKPTIVNGQILVNIKANGINFAELMARQGTYDRAPPTPFIPGYEGAGVVEEVAGDGPFQVGDRVIVMGDFGMWCEYVAVPFENAWIMPAGMTFEEGAAIPVNYLTAHMMLFDLANLRPNKSVLVHMAAGGVGIAATQLCRTVPNVTVFGTSSAHKHKVIEAEGVTHPIDYRTQDYVEEIRRIQPEGVDIVLDPLSGDDTQKGLDLLKPLGKIICFGVANMVTGDRRSLMQVAKTWWQTQSFTSLRLMSENKSIAGLHLGYLTQNTALIRECMGELLRMYSQGLIKPRIDSVWPYEQVGAAMMHMHDRKNIGKVVISTEKKAGAEGAELGVEATEKGAELQMRESEKTY